MDNEKLREVFIKNIPYDIEEDSLAEWCSSFGPISRCVLKRDKFGYSRGFAFVTYETIEGHNNILSQGPHTCQNRSLFVKTAYASTTSTEGQSNSPSDYPSQVTHINENFQSIPPDTNIMYEEDDNDNELASLRDELDANLECMQIAHEHEIKLLRERLSREQKLRDDAQVLYKEAEEDWRKVQDENIKLRTSLVKNVMQTFNIRRDFARRTKEQLGKCSRIEQQQQLPTIQFTRSTSKKS